MKPVSVRFKCFGPYMQEQLVDFEELERNGLFLICGETGAGKTTILDAICYALYGHSSGGLRGDMEVMRCKLAQKQDETLTEFIFDSNGKRYKFVRTLKYARKNLNDFHNCMVLEGEVYVPLLENPTAKAVSKKAEELIGLTYDQFRQVIILPQGKFETLLVSNSVEKEKILVSLFHADRWQRIADELHHRVSERDAELKQEKQRIALKLREYGCEKLPQLEEKILLDSQNLEQLKADSAAAEAAVKTCRARREQALLENEAFAELARREKRLAELTKKTAAFRAEEALLKNADQAEKIRPEYLAFREARSAKLRAEEQAALEQKAVSEAGKALAAAEAAWQLHERESAAHQSRRQFLTLLENARELYRSIVPREAQVKSAEKARFLAEKEKIAAERIYAKSDKAWQDSLLCQTRAIAEYQQTQQAYLRGIGSVLARKLTEGEACPVCGSREHPDPARQTGEHVTDAQMEAKNAAMNAANDAVSETMHRRAETEKTKNQAIEAFNRAAQAEALARADYENALSRRLPEIGDEKQLERKIADLKRSIADFEAAETKLQETRDGAKSRDTAAKARLDAAKREALAAQTRYTAQMAVWQEALERSGLETEAAFRNADLEPEEKQRRRTALSAFRADLTQAEQMLRQQREALAGQSAPDMAAVQKALAEAEKEGKTLSNRVILAENGLKTMKAAASDLAKRTEAYEAARVSVEADMDFASRLRGRSGVSLQRYVLGVMLTSITVEANRLLANVYGGRYSLYRTDEISGSSQKGGLELEVYDSQNNQRRSVTTLSGGEKFLVALSLAIGLSTVVQAQGGGIRLEAMFIDEGFGSLDREAVNDALEVLQGIQRSSGIVGIISHVEQLAEVIPTRLEISKGKQGSTCRVCG